MVTTVHLTCTHRLLCLLHFYAISGLACFQIRMTTSTGCVHANLLAPAMIAKRTEHAMQS